MADDYYIAEAGDTKGPYSRAQLKSMWDHGLISSDTQYWREGMDDWYLVETLLESEKGNDPSDPARPTGDDLQTSPVSTQPTMSQNVAASVEGLASEKRWDTEHRSTQRVDVPKQNARFRRSGINTWSVAILLVIALSYTPLGDSPGFLKTIRGATNSVLSMVGLRDNAIAWMMTYWEDNVSLSSLPKEDALRLAKACVQYDRNPK